MQDSRTILARNGDLDNIMDDYIKRGKEKVRGGMKTVVNVYVETPFSILPFHVIRN